MSAGFSHNCEDSGHRRTRTDHPEGDTDNRILTEV